MKNFFVIPNTTKTNSVKCVRRICEILKSTSRVYMSDKYASCGADALFLPEDEIYAMPDIDVAIVLGGDGTMLANARRCSMVSIPMLGINLGRLGFMTEADEDGMETVLNKLVQGDYTVEQRMMIEACIINSDGKSDAMQALNDIVISRASVSRLVDISISVDGDILGCYRGDGAIIATPTGSTAYSLSAGGPIVAPLLEAMIVTPICPHTTSARSIITPADKIITISLGKEQNLDAMLTIDGQEGVMLKHDDIVEIKKSAYSTRLVKLSGRSFYDVLRQKLTERGTSYEV